MKRIARNLIGLSMVLIAGLASGPAGGQYIVPGSQLPSDTTPAKDELEERINDARWNLGAVRLTPWLGLRDVQLVRTTSADGTTEEDDFTLTIGAGLRAYLPTGKVVWTAHALPEYVWWQDDENKRSVNGRLGLGLFAYLNRMTVELSQRNQERQGFFSSEIQELTTTRTDTSRLGLEVDLGSRLSLFGIAERREDSNQEEENPLFSLLDRDEESVEIGARYRIRDWLFGVSYRDASTEFVDGARDLSNSGTAQRLEVIYDRPKLEAHLNLSFPDFEGDAGSDFGRFDDTTGNLDLIGRPSRRLNILGYARRRQSYSVDSASSFLVAERQGLRLDFGAGRVAVGVFGEIGEDDFGTVSSSGAERVDDVSGLGIDLRFELWKLFLLSIEARSTDYDSNIPGLDREVTSFGFALELGKVIEKLQLGSSAGDW
ncbi:MAG: hypothetical protein GY719_10995 [bacterium]|nr:hypothetical protein [bacterium]